MEKIKTIVVLGMHRSATSMLSRSMHESNEVWMGDQLILNLPDNPKGHYEQRPIVLLNDQILKAAGGSWFNPPSREEILEQQGKWDLQIKRELDALESGANGSTSIGFKDPRMCLLIELWEPFIKNPQYVCSFRNESEIAKSLNRRDGIAIDDGIKLTKEYNSRVIKFISERY